MRKTFVDTLIQLAEEDPRTFLLTADMGYSVLEPFIERFPDRYLNSGITEQATISMAAGLALSGYVVYAYSITPFITKRCFEQIRLDLAYMQTNVKIIGVGAGFEYGVAGATHHATEDLALMRVLPNMMVLAPGDNYEAAALMKEAHYHNGPVYLRIGRNKDAFYSQEDQAVHLGKARLVHQGKGDLAIITTSNTLSLAWDYKSKYQDRAPSIISMHTLKPIDKECILELIKNQTEIISIEEHNIIGGLGSAIAEIIAESGQGLRFTRIGVPDVFSHSILSQDGQRSKYGISPKI